MESKLNHQAIDGYSKAFAKKICENHFDKEEHVNGPQLLELTPLKQVNLIVLKNLFKRWKKETSKLQSPFFNYQHKDVKKAIKDFMNVLSRHIAIRREHFEPLLREAVKDSILLIFSPYDFYSKEINQRDSSRIGIADLKELKKYIKINDFLLDALIESFEIDKVEVAFNDEAFERFNEVCSTTTVQPEDFEPYQQVLSEIVPLSLKAIYLEEDEEVEHKSAERKTKEHTTLNDGLRKFQPSTVADSISKGKSKSIKAQLTLNQRFMFVNELFEGNQDLFHKAVDEIDAKDDYSEAFSHIKNNYAKSHDWDMEAEEVQEFMEVVGKRFQ